VVKLMAGGSPVCNGFVVEGTPALIATPAYCVQAAGRNRITVRGAGGGELPVRSTRMSPDGLVALIDVGAHPLPPLRLSRRQIVRGDDLLQLAFDLMEKESELKVNLGDVTAVVQTTFFGADQEKKVPVTAYRVALDSPRGSAGGPLLDSEGNVACMTFQGTAGGRVEECLPASYIQAALTPARAN
jgi:hypothetical protein